MMERIADGPFAAAAFSGLCSLLCALAVFPTQAQPLPKKLIEYGWDVPSPAFVRQHVAEMEKRPFDGIVMRLKGGANVFTHKPAPTAPYDEDEADLSATQFANFTDNFVLAWAMCDKGWDWFDDRDWQASETNIRRIARAGRAGRCAGICWDPEPYGGNPWLYSEQPGAKTHTFAEYERQARKRGAQFMRAIQAELPSPRILTFFQLSLFSYVASMTDPARQQATLGKEGYGLLPAFLNGMLDGARPGTRIIDGNEPAYYYQGRAPFFDAYHLMRQRGLSLIAPANRAKYNQVVQAGSALYMDQVLSLREPRQNFASYNLTPEQRAQWFQHNVYYALDTSDEYVWCYSEKMSWWENKVPPGAEEAIRSAKAKIRAGQPLGFAVEAIVGEAQAKVGK